MGNTNNMATKSIFSLIMSFSMPAFIALLVNSIYNIVDRVFIGHYVGENALACLTISYPIMYIVFAGAVLIGRGGSNLISLKLGENKKEEANTFFTNTIFISIVLSLVLIIIGLITLKPILSILSTDTMVTMNAEKYLRIVYIGVIFQILSFTMNSIVRSEGFPLLSMISMLVSALANIILDYFFIVILDMGVQGAALATILGQFLGFIILVKHFYNGKSNLSYQFNNILPSIETIKNILIVGSPSFIMTLGSGLAMMLLTSRLSYYGGTPAVASMGAIGSLANLFLIPTMGIQNGIQPLIGYNYGAKLFSRVRQILFTSIILGVIVSSISFIVLQLYPDFFIKLFLQEGSKSIEIAINGLRIYISMLPIISINMIASGYFQSIADPKKAFILGAMRQTFFLLPLLLLLPNWLGLKGVWISTPISDFIAISISILFLMKEYRRLNVFSLKAKKVY